MASIASILQNMNQQRQQGQMFGPRQPIQPAVIGQQPVTAMQPQPGADIGSGATLMQMLAGQPQTAPMANNGSMDVQQPQQMPLQPRIGNMQSMLGMLGMLGQ